MSLRARVSAVDQARLDQHAQFIRDLEAGLSSGGGSQAAASCSPPSPSSVPNYQTGNWGSSGRDDLTTPIVINSMVQALACDVSRSLVLAFENTPTWDFLFPNGGNPFLSTDWHSYIHGHGQVVPATDPLTKTYQWYGQMFTLLVQSLANTTDIDGSRLLDNTLVVWTSALGWGTHVCHDIPVVMAGLKSAFPKGQGRHVVCNRNSMGDVWTQVLSMLGVSNYGFGAGQTLFGLTGTLGDHPAAASTDVGKYNDGVGYPGFISASTPFHVGPLDI
jgi:hypothetical protein